MLDERWNQIRKSVENVLETPIGERVKALTVFTEETIQLALQDFVGSPPDEGTLKIVEEAMMRVLLPYGGVPKIKAKYDEDNPSVIIVEPLDTRTRALFIWLKEGGDEGGQETVQGSVG